MKSAFVFVCARPFAFVCVCRHPLLLQSLPQRSEPPIWGRQKGATPICSDLFQFPRFLPICADLHSLFSGMPRFVPICSDLLRFLPICSDLFSERFQNKSGKPLSAEPFFRIIIRGVPSQGGTGLDTYPICIQARFDTYQFPILI